jgi:hypothetical protein
LPRIAAGRSVAAVAGAKGLFERTGKELGEAGRGFGTVGGLHKEMRKTNVILMAMASKGDASANILKVIAGKIKGNRSQSADSSDGGGWWDKG